MTDFIGRDAIPYARFSSNQQQHGMSLERQSNAFDSFVKKSKANPRYDLAMDDKGKSAYKGQHILENGALGNFIYKLEGGDLKLPTSPKPLLVVEEVDRLTRLEPDDGQELLLRLMRYVDICVVDPSGSSYQLFARKGQGSDIGSIILLTIKIYSAHDHSKKLSKRVGIAHAKSLSEAVVSGKALRYGTYPFWLRKNGDKYELVLKWVEILNEVYVMLSDGIAPADIANTLNEKGYKVPRTQRDHKKEVLEHETNRWNTNRVRVLYSSRTPIGKMKPVNHQTEIDLYPPAISEDLYFKAIAVVNRRKRGSGNKIGRVKSLFAGFTYCYACRKRMHTDTRLRNGISDVRMRCSSRASATLIDRDCDCGYISMDFEERLLILLIDKVALSDLLVAPVDNQVSILSSKISICEQEISEFNKLLKTSIAPALYQGLAVHQDKLKELEAKLVLITPINNNVITENYEEIAELAQASLDPKNETERARMNVLINSIVNRVELYKKVKQSSIIIVNFKSGIRRMYTQSRNVPDWNIIELEPALEQQHQIEHSVT
ncbi:recombinase family protein [Shewanella benthica]|uniref:recombinase family protein n=1 Tax=Shewanella benthica TaxID=43661 RepID=UPI00187A6A11|nr:recombinase family protein [Shewanella benthica]MBE7216373.1 recombinase family protein [Shewanella benthica]MCL1065125.1 recombinase family protein [Shewanella benthica]